MIKREKPHFIVKNNFQKSRITGMYANTILTDEVLKEMCEKLTNISDYTIQFVDNDYSDEFREKGYNEGRVAILLYEDYVNYIAFSPKILDRKKSGRNSAVQSAITAFNLFYNSKAVNKRLYYYFLDSEENRETDYYLFVYRLMSTIGFEFINIEKFVSTRVVPFNSMEDIISARKSNKSRNKSNNSTYVTKSSKLNIDIYGKTYGASKYETTMISYAVSMLATSKQKVTLYEVLEQDLKELPEECRAVISKMGVIDVIMTDMTLEKIGFNESNSFRSPRYTHNLLNKFGRKKCAFCECSVPESIQGAHIWPVGEIKKDKLSSSDRKLEWAIDGENGLWLCSNHHTWFDKNIIRISLDGDILIDETIEHNERQFIENMTTIKKLPKDYLTPKFVKYVEKRYNLG